jgi:hypothetical protein
VDQFSEGARHSGAHPNLGSIFSAIAVFQFFDPEILVELLEQRYV